MAERTCLRRKLLVGLAIALAAESLASARPTTSVEELKRLTLDELLAVEVTSAGKRPQPLRTVPAAISVIGADEIRRSGARTLPDALRLATGVQVARFDSRSWAISARGFNSVNADKMLVLVDGRSVYTPLFAGTFWDVQNPLLEDVDRIEVIRGPGAVLWGANAVNGVVNVITRPADETRGGLALARAGSEAVGGAFRWGGPVGSGAYRVYAKIDDHDGLVFADGRDATDDLRLGHGGFRIDLPVGERDLLTAQGEVYEGTIGHPFREESDVDGGHLIGHWARRLSAGSDLTVRAYVDHTFRRVPGQFQEERATWDIEARQHLLAGVRHQIVWGAGYRESADRVPATAQFAWRPEEETVRVANVFAQDEVSLGSRWNLVMGAKLEDQSTMDLELQPTLRLAWFPTGRQTVWAGAARAVRAPARIDRSIRVPGSDPPIVVGNPAFEPEEVIAYELGYRAGLRGGFHLDLALFRDEYDDLRSQEPSPTPSGLPLVLGNGLEGTVQGAELSLQWDPAPRWRFRGGLTTLDKDLRAEPGSGDRTGGTAEGNDPDLHGFLRADLDLPKGWQLGAWWRHVGDLPAPEVPAYSELDLRLAWSPRPGLVLSIVGQNLLDDHHPEFGPPMSREEVERAWYTEVVWRF